MTRSCSHSSSSSSAPVVVVRETVRGIPGLVDTEKFACTRCAHASHSQCLHRVISPDAKWSAKVCKSREIRRALRGARSFLLSPLPPLLFLRSPRVDPVSRNDLLVSSGFSLSLSLSRSRPLRGARTNALRLCESQTSACDISRSCNRILPLCILATNKNAERRRARASAAIPGAHDNGDDRRQRLLNIDQSFARRRRSELREKGRMVASLNREAIAS
jgi:hypothetical protein